MKIPKKTAPFKMKKSPLQIGIGAIMGLRGRMELEKNMPKGLKMLTKGVFASGATFIEDNPLN